MKEKEKQIPGRIIPSNKLNKSPGVREENPKCKLLNMKRKKVY